jgi:uncharacterized protein (DUF983 family)
MDTRSSQPRGCRECDDEGSATIKIIIACFVLLGAVGIVALAWMTSFRQSHFVLLSVGTLFILVACLAFARKFLRSLSAGH